MIRAHNEVVCKANKDIEDPGFSIRDPNEGGSCGLNVNSFIYCTKCQCCWLDKF